MSTLSFDYSGQVVLVTGGARGIGRAVGRFFAGAGAEVHLLDFDGDGVAATAAEIGARWSRCDVSDTASADAAVASVVDRHGRLDVLVNNAGILRDTVLWKLTDDDWERVMAVHAGGTFRMTRAVVPHLRARGYGRIVNVTSYSGLRGNVGQANYSTAKAGIVGFTKTAAKELARFGITVNAVSPNAETRMIASIPQAKREEMTAAIPMGRFADPAEMCAAVGFLASREAGYITGAVLPVDGGMAM
ncbi:beta-ketoacyl-ACP reductase [Sphaerisporangium siamense]|uniref:3-oxoacyl-[acyl-carrier protein] reductase n=1 Tax=Sphaerisporangium siamense TaxID=795645 RepID=A0A7W7DC06_9ACTN|nr:SDR family NAD(P)-dependent oxidoreductase [Sphaerisporangium siamense]MBB4703816.1 3-oxoacyl-[acyl-carrier protein] reductase [Sphaerisporangium siamense]GII82285.1 beta-ketoacyl-ACP reductase [Sphaerisporangium siamense]